MNLIPFSRKKKNNVELTKIIDNYEIQRYRLNLTDSPQVALPSSKMKVLTTKVIKNIRKVFTTFFSSIFRSRFEYPEWNFEEIDRAIQSEALVRRAVEKYVEQIFKNGFEFKGKNEKTVKYIKNRFHQISIVTGIPTVELFQKIAFSLVAYANVIVIKKRSERASGGKVRRDFKGKTLKPVAGYYVLSPTEAMVEKDEYNNPIRWKQKHGRGYYITKNTPSWVPDDVIFYKDSTATDPKYLFALPMILSVLPDVRALRETEELTMLQAVKFAVPKLHAKIGSKDKPGTQEEINLYADYFSTVPADAVMVTSNRVDLTSVTSNDQVLELEPYLEYWRQRVLSGLGMSKVGMGEGNTANRSTAQVIAAEMQNTSIKFQNILKIIIEEFMIKELLYEAGYTEFTLNDVNMVYVHFDDIDLENKIKRENHFLNLFQSNAITFDELRNELGRYKLSPQEEKELFIHKFGNLNPAVKNQIQSKEMPTNQHGTQLAKPKITKD